MVISLSTPINKDDHYIGSLNAPVVMVEYGDFECPNTARVMNATDKLIEEFRDHICFVFRHFPLIDIHPNSVLAALATEAAHEQGKFWKMYRHILNHQDKLSGEFIVESAKSVGLDQEKFLSDLENNDEYLQMIQKHMNCGVRSGVNDRTPTFFLNSIKIEYPTNYNLLRDEILAILRETPISI
ncbi:MAG TPA: thioredoxin domain-containing protein [Bacteriovoracaceae bacterium]|nr:thioredoxin domain-containing protein [Bacteriovoracaceae bacterium]